MLCLAILMTSGVTHDIVGTWNIPSRKDNPSVFVFDRHHLFFHYFEQFAGQFLASGTYSFANGTLRTVVFTISDCKISPSIKDFRKTPIVENRKITWVSYQHFRVFQKLTLPQLDGHKVKGTKTLIIDFRKVSDKTTSPIVRLKEFETAPYRKIGHLF